MLDPEANVPVITSLEDFLVHFFQATRDDDFLTIKHGNYTVKPEEIVGEYVDWTMQYLEYMSCPASLEASLTRAVLDEAKSTYLSGSSLAVSMQQNEATNEVDASPNTSSNSYKTLSLLQSVTSTVNQVCKKLKIDEKTFKNVNKAGRTVPSSVHAVKNGRRKMEDRHVLFHDLNAIYCDSQSEEPPLSFYAVYDGHAGKDAAAFAASHLHGKILASSHYPTDPVEAIKEAFNQTDEAFLEKRNNSGTTAVFTFIRGQTIYAAWLGDSQAILVRNGYSMKIIEPHKPNRPDEKTRIENLGGAVVHWGTWRVNGQLAVSRAIGDGNYKPYVCSDPDVTTIVMNGTEDFLIVACDGLWDTVTPDEATECVFKQLQKDKGEPCL
jgi:protein phosphatase 1E